MGMTPVHFFDSFVEGNLTDCHEAPGDIRRAFNAAVSASHFADQYFIYNKRHYPHLVSSYNTLGQFIETLERLTDGGFRDIRSISNAYKHLYTNNDKKKAAHSSINSSGVIESIQLSDVEDIKCIEEEYLENKESERSIYQVIFTRKDGSISIFLPVLEKVVKHFRTMLYEIA
ncbi:hypothetical protein [uncultured Desulfobacter sp.]|uniref:hypothetical protein n=1 Tax=uncultured Desulfobacter sp. TaxID=240139 RepID=UPI0029F48A88|nr:hypothetical protein [uncultured Desulfobacter sp.]